MWQLKMSCRLSNCNMQLLYYFDAWRIARLAMSKTRGKDVKIKIMNIVDIFESFKNKKVLIVGDAMIDSYMWGEIKRISPEAPVPIVNINKYEKRLGGAANVALNVKSMGAQPILCSVIGNKKNYFLQ